jgi:hypothetical protein
MVSKKINNICLTNPNIEFSIFVNLKAKEEELKCFVRKNLFPETNHDVNAYKSFNYRKNRITLATQNLKKF